MDEADPDARESHHEAIRREYREQAPGWATTRQPAHLRWVVDNLDLRPHSEVLDVAAGTGLLGRAIAPYVGRVLLSDITPEMLALGREEAAREGIANISFEEAAAESLPYPEASFDLVVTRFSVHHFPHPEAVLAEMRRVCRPGGEVAVIDMISPEEEGPAARFNHLERLRDRTHTRALPARELDGLVAGAGLEISYRRSREVEVEALPWLDSARVGPQEREQILAAMRGELEGAGETGLRPFLRGDALMFTHVWELVVGKRPAG